jgi:hypothetical protein
MENATAKSRMINIMVGVHYKVKNRTPYVDTMPVQLSVLYETKYE